MRARTGPAPWLFVALALGAVALVLWPGASWADGATPACTPADAATNPNLLDQYQGWRLFALYGVAFTAGLGASLTPCVYPMIPIVLGIFGARGKDVSRARSLGLATVYVLGMGTTYAVLGTVFALLGRNFSTVLAEPAVVIPICLLYAVLALSMFGAFNLNLPAGLQARLARVGGNGVAGAFAMGLVGGFTAAPCTAPFATSLLTAVGKTGNLAVGASTMFVHAVGIGVLYFVLAVFAGALPRSGRWMEWVKSIGGIGLVVAALYFMRPVVGPLRQLASPAWWFLIASLVLVVGGVALGAVHLSFHDQLKVKLRKGAAVLMVVLGTFGAISWLLAPRSHLPWVHDEAAAFAKARAEGKGVMVDFGADWCTPCAQLEVTFGDEQVYGDLVDNFVPLKFDVTKQDATDRERMRRYDGGTPTVIFMGVDGTAYARIREYVPPSEFKEVMDCAIGNLRAASAR